MSMTMTMTMTTVADLQHPDSKTFHGCGSRSESRSFQIILTKNISTVIKQLDKQFIIRMAFLNTFVLKRN